MALRSRILGTGSYLPEKIVTNDELSKLVETSDEWITERTGIKKRHIVAAGESTGSMAVKAAQAALENAHVAPAELDFILLATSTQDLTFPATAVLLQAQLGAVKAFAFDMQAACTGFVYALATADALLCQQQLQRGLVVGADSMSKIVNWQDRNTCVLFGDGAGAVVIGAETNDVHRGILDSNLHADGSTAALLKTTGGVSTTQDAGVIVMEGREVFRQATLKMSECVLEILQRHQLSVEDVQWLVPHQANLRIITAVAKKLGLPMEKVVVNIADQANTSAATIPVALDAANREQRFQPGDLIVLEALGAGLTWGSLLLRW